MGGRCAPARYYGFGVPPLSSVVDDVENIDLGSSVLIAGGTSESFGR
jgi:hypothetical protein